LVVSFSATGFQQLCSFFARANLARNLQRIAVRRAIAVTCAVVHSPAPRAVVRHAHSAIADIIEVAEHGLNSDRSQPFWHGRSSP